MIYPNLLFLFLIKIAKVHAAAFGQIIFLFKNLNIKRFFG